MIISRTPLRVSFLGGGTDFPEFYNEHGGAVLSAAIDKYIYVVVKKRFDDKIVLHYTKTETVDNPEDLQHDIIKTIMMVTGVEKGIEVVTLGDIPSEGTGLGSSSTLTVGLLNAFYAYQGIKVDAEKLANEACRIEIDIMGKAMGRQDAYIAAYGGLRMITFRKDSIETFHFKRRIRRALQENLMLFYTGVTRQAADILVDVKANIPHKIETLVKLMNLCLVGNVGLENEKISAFGELLNQNWSLKKALADTVTNDLIDDLYARALVAGASGGKICGAGGGGFLLLFCEKDKQDQVREKLNDYQELPFKCEDEGSKIIYQER